MPRINSIEEIEVSVVSIADGIITVRDDDNKSYNLPISNYECYNFKTGDRIIGELRFNERKQILYFEPFHHPHYNLAEAYYFKVVGFRVFKGKEYIVVNDCNDNQINVRPLKWQKPSVFNEDTLKCQVLKINYGRPILSNAHYTHPIYTVGEVYEFKFLGFDIKTKADGSKMDVIRLKGEDGCSHEVPPLPSQYGDKFNPDIIKCKVIEIKSYLKLQQTSYTDVYFSEFEIIVGDGYKSFHDYIASLPTVPATSECLKQYEAKSSFWTITFCNKLVPAALISFIETQQFEFASKLISAKISIEEWILNSGLLTSFKKESTQQLIRKKAESQLDDAKCQIEAISLIVSGEFDIRSDSVVVGLKVLTYYLTYAKYIPISYHNVIAYIAHVLLNQETRVTDQYIIKSLIYQLEGHKLRQRINDLETEFSMGPNPTVPFKDNEKLSIHIALSLLQGYLSSTWLQQRFYIAEALKYFYFVLKTDSQKRRSLRGAFHLLNTNDHNKILNLELLKDISDLSYIFEGIISSIPESEIAIDREDWIKVLNLAKEKKKISVILTKCLNYGFVGEYKDILCILPKSRISSSYLSNFNLTDCKILINCSIEKTYYNFQTLLISEFNINSENYRLENLMLDKVKVGDILNGKVHGIEDYGVFFSTRFGIGLLHRSNISDLFIDIPLKSIFSPGENIHVTVLSIKQDGKLEFGLKQLNDTEHKQDLREVEYRILAPELSRPQLFEDNSENTTNEGKRELSLQGHLLEYFSNLQYDFDGKIKYLQLAKVFYSGISSSRSYFINIYLNYFKILVLIETIIETRDTNKINYIVEEAAKLYDNIRKNTESIEKFPSIYRLIYFLEIIKNINNKSNQSVNDLAKYIIDPIHSGFPTVRKVAKIVLSNNLLISEDENPEYTLRNVRILYYYLKQGIFDISENDSERKERELKEKIAEIRNKVFSEESEKVEFKSSLIAPVLYGSRKKQFEQLLRENTENAKKEANLLIGNPIKRKITHSAMKTLAAFANTKGGTLFIGINDDGEFLGLEADYKEIGKKSRDVLGQKLDGFINDYLKDSFFSLLNVEFALIDNKDILIIDVEPSDSPVFIKKNDRGNSDSEFYIRRHSSSVKLESEELINYYDKRFNQ